MSDCGKEEQERLVDAQVNMQMFNISMFQPLGGWKGSFWLILY